MAPKQENGSIYRLRIEESIKVASIVKRWFRRHGYYSKVWEFKQAKCWAAHEHFSEQASWSWNWTKEGAESNYLFALSVSQQQWNQLTPSNEIELVREGSKQATLLQKWNNVNYKTQARGTPTSLTALTAGIWNMLEITNIWSNNQHQRIDFYGSNLTSVYTNYTDQILPWLHCIPSLMTHDWKLKFYPLEEQQAFEFIANQRGAESQLWTLFIPFSSIQNT